MFVELGAFYSFFLFKYLLFSDYYDLPFYITVVSMLLLSMLYFMNDKLGLETKESIKFSLHALYITITFSLVVSLLSLVYHTIFYYGFTNTIVAILLLLMFVMSETVAELINQLSRYTLGYKIIQIVLFVKDWIVSSQICGRMIDVVQSLLVDYVWQYIKIIFWKFVKINNQLADNIKSIKVKNNFDTKYQYSRNYFIDKIIQPYLVKSLMNYMEQNQMALLGDNSYKNRLLTESRDMSQQSESLERIDDLEDDSGLESVASPDSNQKDTNEKDKQDLRAALRQKIAEKKNIRTGGTVRNRKAMKNELANMMENQELKKMMENMLNGTNLQDLMKQMPKQQNISFNDEHFKKILKDLAKKNE